MAFLIFVVLLVLGASLPVALVLAVIAATWLAPYKKPPIGGWSYKRFSNRWWEFK